MVIPQKRANKKSLVLQTGKKGKLPLAIGGIVLVTAALAVLLIMGKGDVLTGPSNTRSGQESFTARITYPVHLFEDGKARHYEYKNDDLTIQYFVLKSSDGVSGSSKGRFRIRGVSFHFWR
jgi:hypothetical protein